jgi:predicted PurR-regulated permease PerM
MRFRRSDIFFALSLAALLAIAWYLRQALLLLYVAVILAIVLAPAVDRLRSWRLGRWQPTRGTGMVILLLLTATAAWVLYRLIVPPVMAQARTLAADWPTRFAALVAAIHRLPGGNTIHAADLQESVNTAIGALNGLLQRLTSSVTALVFLALLTGYFILDGERAFAGLMTRIRAPHGPRLADALSRAEVRISRWIFGQLLLMLILACVDLVVYGALGLHYFVVLAVIAGLMNVIPVIGPLIGLVPAVLVAATQSPTKLIAVLIFYGIYQQIDNSFITPRVMRATVDVSPVAVIIALIVGAQLAGIAGAFVAVPTAALIEILLEEYVVVRPGPPPEPIPVRP